MGTRKEQHPSQPTGRVVHDSKGNSVWRFNETEHEEFRDTQTWVMRALEVTGLSIDDDTANSLHVAASTDPYNRTK